MTSTLLDGSVFQQVVFICACVCFKSRQQRVQWELKSTSSNTAVKNQTNNMLAFHIAVNFSTTVDRLISGIEEAQSGSVYVRHSEGQKNKKKHLNLFSWKQANTLRQVSTVTLPSGDDPEVISQFCIFPQLLYLHFQSRLYNNCNCEKSKKNLKKRQRKKRLTLWWIQTKYPGT